MLCSTKSNKIIKSLREELQLKILYKNIVIKTMIINSTGPKISHIDS